MTDKEYPLVLREMADKLESNFEQNISEVVEELYEVTSELTVRNEELMNQHGEIE